MSDDDKLRIFFSGKNANSGNLYLGTDILHCGLCASVMVARRLYDLPAPRGGVRVMYVCASGGCQSVDVADADRALQGVAERYISRPDVLRRLALAEKETSVKIFEDWLTTCDDRRTARRFERTGHHLDEGYPTWEASMAASERCLVEALADRALLRADSSREEELRKIEAERDERVAELDALAGDRQRRRAARQKLGGRRKLATRVATLRRTARLLGVTHELLATGWPTPRPSRMPDAGDWGEDVQKHVSERREMLLTGLGSKRVLVIPLKPEPDGDRPGFRLKVVTRRGKEVEPLA